MEHRFFSLGEVGRLLQISPHRITYAIVNQKLPETEFRHAGQRVFSTEDIKRIVEHFQLENPFRPKRESGEEK